MQGIDLFTGLAAKMRHLTERQGMVAGNIAHADLPGYRARDLDAPDFAAMLGGKGVVPRVQVSESLARLGGGLSRAAASERGSFEVKPNGNDVNLENELMVMADVQLDYAAMTNLYRKHMNILRIALGRGRG